MVMYTYALSLSSLSWSSYICKKIDGKFGQVLERFCKVYSGSICVRGCSVATVIGSYTCYKARGIRVTQIVYIIWIIDFVLLVSTIANCYLGTIQFH